MDLYDVLGVEPTASEEDIKKNYRRLSLSYHPDRLHNRSVDDEARRAADRQWLRISAAYDVLGDGRRRMVYDELGPAQFEAGLGLLSPRVDTADKLRRAYAKAQRRAAEREHEARCRLQGSLVLSCSVADVVQPGDPSTPLRQRAPPARTSVAMSEEMSLQLDKRNTLVVASQLLTKSGLGGSTLRLGFRRQLSRHSTLEALSAVDGSPKALSLTCSRRISRHSTASASATLLAAGVGGAAGPLPKVGSLSLKVSRQLTRRTTGELQLSLDDGVATSLALRLVRAPRQPPPPQPPPQAEAAEAAPAAAAPAAAAPAAAAPASLGGVIERRCSDAHAALRQAVDATRARLRRRLGRATADATLRRDGPRCAASVGWRHSRRSRSKVTLSAPLLLGGGGGGDGGGGGGGDGGPSAISLTLATERAISLESGSRFGIALSISPRGIDLKLRIQRHNQRLLVPLHIADSATAVIALMAAAVPAALLAAARVAVVEPRKRRVGAEEAEAAGKEEVAAARTAADARRLAAAEARLISREAAQRALEERACGGLLIREAYYGDVAAARAAAADGGGGDGDESDEGGSGGRWLDVRIALQHAVVDSALRLPAASKAGLRGFAPVEGDAPRLWIAYELAGVACEAEAADAEAVSIGAVR